MVKHKIIGNGVMAHRGNMSEYPENTLVSFESAIKLGADWIELDIQRTKDGHIVVTHDYDTLRVCGEKQIVSQSNLSDLKKLNFGNYINDNDFYELPLLSDVFTLIKKNNCTKVTIQPKNNGLIKQAIKLADSFGLMDRIAFNDINCEYLIEVKQINPKIPVFWDRLPLSDLETDIFISNKFNFDCLMYVKEGLSKERALAIKNEGILIGACVVNLKEDMLRFIKMGIDAFYTDYPSLLIEIQKDLN
jgi:glycerophosphoryl diester phosphodiesterase